MSETMTSGAADAGAAAHRGSDYVSVAVAGQLFGIPIDRVRDVFTVGAMTPVPLAPPDIAGLLNLRGRVTTAIDLCRRLGLPSCPRDGAMAVGIEALGESYCLIVEEVGDVLRLGPDTRDDNPMHMSGSWLGLSNCIHRLDGRLLVVLDVDAVLDLGAGATERLGGEAR